jgi:hypothetical protein
MSKQSAFVPNSFQTPNVYVDQFASFLTPEEFKVLIYATRRILGFQKRQDRISISQFTDGTKSKDGETLDYGIGLSIETIKKCLANLVTFGLMVRLEENDPKTNEGVLWSLQWDEDKVNRKALQERKEQKEKTDAERMAKARSMRQAHPIPQTPVSETERTPTSPTDPPSPSGIETQKTEETQRKPVNSDQPALELFRGYFGKFLAEKELLRWLVIYEAAGKERAEELAHWAFKKEIHLLNRASLLDSLETAAAKWRGNGNGNGSKPTDPKPAINEAELDRTRQYNEQRWNFTPAPPPADARPVIRHLAERKGVRK